MQDTLNLIAKAQLKLIEMTDYQSKRKAALTDRLNLQPRIKFKSKLKPFT
jgi:hypothetical protein